MVFFVGPAASSRHAVTALHCPDILEPADEAGREAPNLAKRVGPLATHGPSESRGRHRKVVGSSDHGTARRRDPHTSAANAWKRRVHLHSIHPSGLVCLPGCDQPSYPRTDGPCTEVRFPSPPLRPRRVGRQARRCATRAHPQPTARAGPRSVETTARPSPTWYPGSPWCGWRPSANRTFSWRSRRGLSGLGRAPAPGQTGRKGNMPFGWITCPPRHMPSGAGSNCTPKPWLSLGPKRPDTSSPVGRTGPPPAHHAPASCTQVVAPTRRARRRRSHVPGGGRALRVAPNRGHYLTQQDIDTGIARSRLLT